MILLMKIASTRKAHSEHSITITDLVTVEAHPERKISPTLVDLHLFYVVISRKEVPL